MHRTVGLHVMWGVVKIMVLFWGTLNIRCRIIIGTQKGAIILTIPNVGFRDEISIFVSEYFKLRGHCS